MHFIGKTCIIAHYCTNPKPQTMVIYYVPKVLLACIFTVFSTAVGLAQVGINTTTPNGILEVNSANTGVVLPRIALTATNVMAPATNPQTGTIPAGTVIYNTNTTTAGIYSVYPGMYVWDGAKWNPQFVIRQYVLSRQHPNNMELDTSNGNNAVPMTVNSFTANYTGWYKVEVNVNYGGGYVRQPSSSALNIAAQKGTFTFSLGTDNYLIPVSSFSTKYRTGGAFFWIWRQNSIVFYVQLNRNANPSFSLNFNQISSDKFENDGNSGSGMGIIGLDIPCTVEFTYVGAEL